MSILLPPLKSTSTFLPLKLSRNKLSHTIVEADPATYPERAGITYFLEVSRPAYIGSAEYVTHPALKRKEKPPYTQVGVTIYEGATFTNIQNLIDGFLERRKPYAKQGQMSVAWGLTSPFRIRERVEPAIINRQLPTMYAIKAGISEVDYSLYGDSFFATVFKSKFMTFQPNKKIVSWKSEEYLYFLLNFLPLPQRLELVVRVTLTDGSQQLLNPLSSATTIHSLALYQVMCIPVGPAILKLPADCVSYDVWLINEANERLSEVRHYWIDQLYQAQERGILFANSLGAFDTLRLTGEAATQLAVSRNVVEMDTNSTVELAELRIVEVKGIRKLLVSTGYLRKDMAENRKYFNELLLSEELYEITDKGHLPLILETSEYVDAEDNPELFSFRLTFRYAVTERNFSALPTLATSTARPTAWRGYGEFSCELDSRFRRTGKAVFERIELYYPDTNEAVRPRQIKLNLTDDTDYVAPYVYEDCSLPNYLSEEQSMVGSFIKQGCVQPFLGKPATITIAAGSWGSEVSIDEANARAVAEMNSLNTQQYANLHGSCQLGAFINIAMSQTCSYVRQGCGPGFEGTAPTLAVAAGKFSSDESQAAADTLAQDYLDSLDTQAYADIHGQCQELRFENAAIVRQGTFSKQTCITNYAGLPATITIPEGRFVSTESQADADAQAELYFLQLNTQTYANTYGRCVPPGVRMQVYRLQDNDASPYGITFTSSLLRSSVETVISHGDYDAPELGFTKGALYHPPILTDTNNRVGWRFTGYLKPPVTGDVELWLEVADDEWAALYLNNQSAALIERLPTDPAVRVAITAMEEGTMIPFELRFVEFQGWNFVTLKWKYEGLGDFELVPASAYYNE